MDRRAEQGAGQRGGAAKSIVTFLGVVMLLLAAALAGAGYLAYREATGPGPLDQEAIVLLKTGSSVSSIAGELKRAGVIRHPLLFKAVVRARNLQGALKAGEYRFAKGATMMEAIDLVVSGKSILHYFTAPEGRTTAQILRLIAANPTLEGSITIGPAEGDLLPETYAFTRGETRDAMVRTMMNARNVLLEELWDGRALELPFNTRAEAIILASIVEKETGIAEERPRIAAVFVNRLKKRMRLESDPTVIYGLTGGEPLGRGIRVSELRKETPYNTYVVSGLPPTPIANPGRESIEAVLNPADTNDLFFVADGSGGHAFAATLDEHNRNVAKWRRVERDQAGATDGP